MISPYLTLPLRTLAQARADILLREVVRQLAAIRQLDKGQ